MAERRSLATLQARREHLIARSAWLRNELQVQASALGRPPAWMQPAQAGFGWLRTHPQWMVGGATLLLLLARPTRGLRWGGRVLAVWQFWQRTGPLWLRLWDRWGIRVAR